MNSDSEKKNMELDDLSLLRLNRTGKWGMFIGTFGLIALGIMLVGGALAGVFLTLFKTGDSSSGMPDEMVVITAVMSGIICLFPVFFLLRFSRFIRHAVKHRDAVSLRKAFRNLLLYFTYIGILIIIILLVYIAVLIISGSSLSLV
jgi:hypothetical protein